jgi:hypothetical protein
MKSIIKHLLFKFQDEPFVSWRNERNRLSQNVRKDPSRNGPAFVFTDHYEPSHELLKEIQRWNSPGAGD